MKKFFLFLLFLLLTSNAYSKQELIHSLQEGGKVVFIRHAYAPGNGDPKNFTLKSCSNQRNLNNIGIEQAIKIGLFFKRNKIKIDKVLSSEWCRCKDTAKFAFKNFEKFNALNSFYDSRFAHNKEKQIKDLKRFIKNWHSKKNLILITHFVVISEVLDVGSSSGEILISDKDFNVIGSIETNN